MKTLLLTLTLAFTGAIAHAQQADDILGEWYSERRNLVFEITRNDVGRYEGKIIWSEDPNRKDKFGKSLVGMTTLTDLFYTSDGRYGKRRCIRPKKRQDPRCHCPTQPRRKTRSRPTRNHRLGRIHFPKTRLDP